MLIRPSTDEPGFLDRLLARLTSCLPQGHIDRASSLPNVTSRLAAAAAFTATTAFTTTTARTHAHTDPRSYTAMPQRPRHEHFFRDSVPVAPPYFLIENLDLLPYSSPGAGCCGRR